MFAVLMQDAARHERLQRRAHLPWFHVERIGDQALADR